MSKMNAVQVEISEQEATFAPAAGALREQAAARLAAHRQRRLPVAARLVEAAEPGVRGGARSARIAAAVAERYAQTQSYGAFLAAEAANSVRLAEAAAELAARNAEAMAAARRVLLEELAAGAAEGHVFEQPEAVAARQRAESGGGGVTVRLYEDVGRGAGQAERVYRSQEAETAGAEEELNERRMLDEEIAYRQSPTEDLERTSVAIPGNLLEFPRVLVAARKARARYAEGPLREDTSQLRIFEVEAVQTAAPVAEPAGPEWSSIWLDALATPSAEEAEEAGYPMAQRPETAAISQRVMAGMVDGCLLGAGYVGFATVFVWRAEMLPTLAVAGMATAVVLGFLYLMYQMLFFTLGEATPGMRYARIGLCTFGDENPTRGAMRRRTLAVLLAACPLGLGFLWACLDEDRLGWHDRISRMYPRSY